jgi:hypothetical protein
MVNVRTLTFTCLTRLKSNLQIGAYEKFKQTLIRKFLSKLRLWKIL